LHGNTGEEKDGNRLDGKDGNTGDGKDENRVDGKDGNTGMRSVLTLDRTMSCTLYIERF